MSTLSAPLLSTNSVSPNSLSPTEVQPFLEDLVKRFEPDGELDAVLGPVITQLCFHASLFRPEGLAGSDASWRGVLSGLEALVSIKAIAQLITRLPQWIPEGATAPNFEKVSLLGPLLRLGVFEQEWVSVFALVVDCLLIAVICSQLLPTLTSQGRRSVIRGNWSRRQQAFGVR